jgi:uncharacterized OB-fold protein
VVELAEGPRVVANIVECAVDDVSVGMPVTAVFVPLTDEVSLPQFEPRSTPETTD